MINFNDLTTKYEEDLFHYKDNKMNVYIETLEDMDKWKAFFPNSVINNKDIDNYDLVITKDFNLQLIGSLNVNGHYISMNNHDQVIERYLTSDIGHTHTLSFVECNNKQDSDTKIFVIKKTISYQDRESVKEDVSNLLKITDHGELLKYINTILPGWVLYVLDGYSNDYNNLDKNWDKVCKNVDGGKKKIILTSTAKIDDNHTFMMSVCEYLTKLGYCVRDKYVLQPCEKCAKAIPTNNIHGLMKSKKIAVPDEWSPTCSKC